MNNYRVMDSRTGGEVQVGDTVTDHCGHTAKLIEVTGPTTVKAEWLHDGITGDYPIAMFISLTIEET